MAKVVARRSVAAGTAAVLAAGVLALWGGTAADAARRRSLTVVDTVSLSLVRKNGNVLYERGTASGNLPGTVSARFVTSLTQVTGTITLRPYSGGSITMTAAGYPQSASRITRITGNLAVRSGTGKFARALGSGTFSGTANRRSWSVTVNARVNVTY